MRDAPSGWQDDPQFVYIGRPSVWGNPWPLRGYRSREQAIRMYTEWAEKNRMIQGRIGVLKGKTLVCYCAPRACHGDVLAAWAEEKG